MPECPRCRQPIESTAITCPYCRTTLKAHGHPGITLFRATDAAYLCQTCSYHADDTCNFPQRPYAKECTLYHNASQPSVEAQRYRASRSTLMKLWFRQHGLLLILLSLLVVSFVLALTGR